MTVKIGLNLVSGIIGVAASIFWFYAAKKVPPPGPPGVSFLDVFPSPEFPKAWNAATNANKWAAALTGISVLLWSAAALLPEQG